jgi:hypothetical protein
MIVLMFVSPLIVGHELDMAQAFGSWIGLGLDIVLGTVVFPLVYAFFLHGVLPGPDAIQGIVSGFIFWLFAQAIVMPLLGAGFFGTKMTGLMMATGSLIGHLVYGTLLGWIAGSTKPSAAPG